MPPFAVDLGNSLQQTFDAIFGFLPNLVGFLLILAVGWIVARILRAVVRRALGAAGVDKTVRESPAGPSVERVSPGASPTNLVAGVVYWLVLLFALSAAIAALQVEALTAFIADVQAYLPNVVAAVLILALTAFLASIVAGAVKRLMGDTPMGRVASTVAPVLILAIGTFMTLNQLRIAPEIVVITYAALMGMLALAGALAFGIGGRHVAEDMLRRAYDQGEEDVKQAKDRDRESEKARAKDAAGRRTEADTGARF